MDWCAGTIGRSRAAGTAALVTLLALVAGLLGAGSARAVVVHLPNGQVVGITPRAGVAPSSIPGVRRSGQAGVSDNGNVDYHGGPVVHSSAPYLIFWDPASTIPASTNTLMTQYFTDVAHDSALATNVYGVMRQYSDQTGIADYQQSFSSAQVIVDPNPYPPRDVTNCPRINLSSYPICLTDAQLQAELTSLISAHALPTDGLTSASELVANAPIYFLVTPANVNVCVTFGSGPQCASNAFCSYHSSYTDGLNNVLYASIPLLIAENPAFNPKVCQSDNTTAVQKPNANPADVVLKYLSHEDSETITDPLGGGGWYDTASGNEVGDSCNTTSDNLQAFEPRLGGSPLAGTLYDQVVNGHHYYIQSEWSNGNVDCKMQPSTDALTPSFAAPEVVAIGSAASFDPTATSSTGGYSSIAWNFGDGDTRFASTATTGSLAPAPIAHVFASLGTYTVTLTVIDTYGNVSTTTHDITVANTPAAAFTASSLLPPAGTPVSFDGSGSSDPTAGASISAYDWSFGDGGTAIGATPTHTYSTAGVYTVTLTVIDSLGIRGSVSKQVEVLAGPHPAFTFSPPAVVAGQAVTLTAAASDPNVGGSITSYSWSFGDGASATGATVSHTFLSPGSYTARLTAADSFGLSASVSHLVVVTASGKPRSFAGSLSGVGKGKPKLGFAVAAGANAPGLRKVVIGLPVGLSFVKQGLASGVAVKSAGGQKLAFTTTLGAGKLKVTLKRGAGAVKVTVGGRAIKASRGLARRVKGGKVHTLRLSLTAIDSAGNRTPLPIALGV